MYANTCVIICPVSQTSRDPGSIPNGKASSAMKAEGEELPLPSPGLGGTDRGRDENAAELMKNKILF